MNKQRIAAEASLQYAKTFMANMGSDFEKADYPHLHDMAAMMEDIFDEGMRNRYLGWIQACICIAAVGTEGQTAEHAFDTMININESVFR